MKNCIVEAEVTSCYVLSLYYVRVIIHDKVPKAVNDFEIVIIYGAPNENQKPMLNFFTPNLGT